MSADRIHRPRASAASSPFLPRVPRGAALHMALAAIAIAGVVVLAVAILLPARRPVPPAAEPSTHPLEAADREVPRGPPASDDAPSRGTTRQGPPEVTAPARKPSGEHRAAAGNDGPPAKRSAATAARTTQGLPGPETPRPAGARELITEVEGVVRRLRHDFPDNADCLELAARAHLWMADTAESVKAWERCLQLNPDYAYAYQGLGSVAVKKGEHAKAVPLLRKALALMPDSQETEVELAAALIDLGEPQEARELLERRGARSVQVRFLLAMACLELKDDKAAVEHYTAVIRMQPQHANAYYGLARAYARLGQRDQARQAEAAFHRLRAEERSVRQNERSQYDDLQAMCAEAARTYAHIGRLYLLSGGEAAIAERLWRRAATLDPKDIESRQALAWQCRQGGRLPEAVEWLRQLAALEPGDIKYDLEIGRLLAEMGRWEEAEKTFQDVCRRAPRQAEPYAALARLYAEGKRKRGEARALAEKAVALEGKNPAYRELLQSLETP